MEKNFVYIVTVVRSTLSMIFLIAVLPRKQKVTRSKIKFLSLVTSLIDHVDIIEKTICVLEKLSMIF